VAFFLYPSFRSTFVHRLRRFTLSKIVSVILLFAAACAVAAANEPKSKALSCVSDPADFAGLSGDASADIHAVQEFMDTTHRLLEKKKFTQLDCLAESFRESKERFPGGMWKLHNMYTGLSKPPLHATGKDWKTHLALVHEWAAVKPQSITARITLAESYRNYGWDARGDGYSDTVSQNGWKILAESSKKAKNTLDEAAKLPKKCPEWYLAMQWIASDLDWEPARRRALFDEAIKFEPGYYYYYRLYAEYTQPKWGGQPGETEKFLREQADKLGGDPGDILYFQVANNLVCGCGADNDLNLSWPRIQKGFAAVERKYGVAMENLNLMAAMAGAFRDALVANQMFERIGEQWSETKWVEYKYFDRARQWAKGVAPFQQKQHEIEDIADSHSQTPVGQQYKAAVEAKMQELIKPCLGQATSGIVKFHWFLKVGKDGTIESVSSPLTNELAPCLGPKLKEFHDSNQSLFPPPPEPSYWVRFDFDPADFARAAAQ
jgi:hypothetical protein